VSDQILGSALIELRASQEKLAGDLAKVSDSIISALEKVEKQTANTGLAGLAKEVEQFARETEKAEKQIQALKFDAIASDVSNLVSAFKSAESGVQITEDLARAEALLEERFGMVRAEIQRQADAQRGLVDEETLLTRTTLQLEAAQRQHDQALATVRGKAVQAAEGLSALDDQERAAAASAVQTSDGVRNLGEAISHAAAETQKAEERWARLKPSLSGMADAARSAGLAFGAFAGGVGTVGAATVKLTMEAAHIGEAFHDLAIKTSTSVESLSHYALAADTAGVSQDTLAVGMRKLATAAVDAKDSGSESAKAFAQLGVEVFDANGQIKPMGQLLTETTQALAAAGDGADTMAAAQQLLGRSAQDFLPLAAMTREEINDLALASEQLGLTWTDKDAKAADNLSDSVVVLQSGVKGLGLSIGRDLIPLAQQVTDESLSWMRANSELMRSGFKDWVAGVAEVVNGLAPAVRAVADAFLWWSGGLDNTFGGLNQQIRDTEKEMQDLIDSNKLWWFESEATTKASKEYKNLETQLAGLKERMEAAKGVVKPFSASLHESADASNTAADGAKRVATAHKDAAPAIADTGKAAKEASDHVLDLSAEEEKLYTVTLKTGQTLKVTKTQFDAIKRGAEAAADGTGNWQAEMLRAIPAGDDFAAGIERTATAAEKTAPAIEDTATAADGWATTADAAGQVTDDFAKSLVDLAVSGGKAEDVLKSLGSSVLNDLTSSLTSGLGDMLKTGLSKAGNALAGGLADAISPGVTAAAEQVGASGAEALVGTMADGIASLAPDAIVGALGVGGTAAAIAAGVAGIGVGIAAAFGAFEGPDIQQQVARMLSKQIKKGFKDPEVFDAINAGLEDVGLFLSDGLGTLMVKAPKRLGLAVGEAWAQLGEDSSYQFSDGFYQDMKEHGTQLIHSSIADVLHVFYKDITDDVATGIQQSAVAAGTAIAKELGFVGDKAIKFAQQWSIAFIGMMQQAGKGADEILVALHRIDASLGTSQELIASFQRLQAEMIDAGVDMDALYAKINEQLKLITGKKMKVGNLEEVLAAVGGDATRALGVIENAMDLAGISIEKFSGGLSDVVLAISNDAGTAIREAGEDFRDFGNEADGTAEILRQKVLTALDDVIATAEELGYSSESIDAFKTAVSLISPEMMRSSEFVNALREDFARMAVESHMSVQELVDSIDPPLPEATRNAILAVNDLGKAIGDLTGAPLKNLKEVTDRMKQFGDEMYRSVVDAEGKVTKELTAFGKELIDEASTAISGMWAQMNEDGWVGLDEIGVMFDQLALLPVEALNDPAIQQATRDLLAKIGAMTGDAAIIAMANAETITQDMIDQGLAAYDEYKKAIEENPPEVPPPTTPDGQPAPTDPTQDPTAPATGAPPPQPIPPETTEGYQRLADTATEYAKAVLAGREAVEALSASTATHASAMLEALRPLIGEPGDGQGLADLNDILDRVLPQTLDDLTLAIAGATGDWKGGFDSARGAVLMLQQALDDLPTDKTITIHVQQDGAIDTSAVEIPTSHTGELIPGMPGSETLRLLEAQELVVPAETATTLPPSLVSALLSGEAFRLPADIVARVSPSVAVPRAQAGAAAATAQASGPAMAPGWRLVPVHEDALIDRALVRIERDVADGYVETGGGFRVHPLVRGRAGR
jgi:hypothetical protein